MFRVEMQLRQTQCAFYRVVALIEPNGKVEKVGHQVCYLAATPFKRLTLCFDVFAKRGFGALRNVVIGNVHRLSPAPERRGAREAEGFVEVTP
jgi:hypothetical protein